MNTLTYRSHYARRETNGMFLKSLRRMKEFVKKLCAFCFNDGDVLSDSHRAGHRRELLGQKLAIDSPFRMIVFHSKQHLSASSSVSSRAFGRGKKKGKYLQDAFAAIQGPVKLSVGTT